jgi:cobalt transporter subunit CbtA
MPRTTRGTPTDSPAIEATVPRFRRLMLVVLCSGALAGLVLFAIQHFTVTPLILKAEMYEKADADHEQADWRPAEGRERVVWTAITTVLTSIGLAAILFGVAALTKQPLTARSGTLWGLAAFACFDVAPALGLPPLPPGAAAAGLYESQLWWAGTAAATAVGLWLLAGARRRWLLRIAGVGVVLLPHLIGAPAAGGENAVPAPLIRQFGIASVATTGVFWILLGSVGGRLYEAVGAQ